MKHVRGVSEPPARSVLRARSCRSCEPDDQLGGPVKRRQRVHRPTCAGLRAVLPAAGCPPVSAAYPAGSAARHVQGTCPSSCAVACCADPGAYRCARWQVHPGAGTNPPPMHAAHLPCDAWLRRNRWPSGSISGDGHQPSTPDHASSAGGPRSCDHHKANPATGPAPSRGSTSRRTRITHWPISVAHAELDNLRTLTAMIDMPVRRAESAIGAL